MALRHPDTRNMNIVNRKDNLTEAHQTGERTGTALTDGKKQWIGYALALSLVLHLGAALVVIFAGSRTGVKTPGGFTIQEVALAPSISAPARMPAEPKPAPDPPEPLPETAGGKVPEQPAAPDQRSPAPAGEQAGVLQSTPLGLGMTRGYFTGLGDGLSLRSDIRDYYFEMVGTINREWWNRSGALAESLRQDGVVELAIQRDGTIAAIRILQGTGSREADRILTEAIQHTRLARLPAGYEGDIFEVPLRIKAPSSLFRLGN